MSDHNPNVPEPKTIDQITMADVQRENTRNEAFDVQRNIGQDMINLRSIQAEADILQAKANDSMDRNGYVPKALQTQLTAKLNTLDYQTGLYKENQTRPDGLERRDANALNEQMDMDTQHLTSVRETNMRSAVNRVMQKEGISKFEAMQMISAEIAVDGAQAEQKYLPQYASVKARLMAQHGDQLQFAQAPSATAQTAPDGNAAMRQAAQAEMRGLIAQNRADIAAGHPANDENYARIEELKKYV